MQIVLNSCSARIWPKALRHFFRFSPVYRLEAACRHGLRIISLLAVALLLPACGAIKIVYNQAPELSYLYLDTYADFTDVQALKVKADLGLLHDWHRQTQLPGYIELLQDTQRQVRNDIQPQQACAIFTDVRRRLLVISEHAQPATAQLAASITAKQVQHMERRLAKANTEYREEFLEDKPEAVRKRRLNKVIDRAETLYGRIDDQQKTMLGRLLDQSGFDANRTYAEKLRRQGETLSALRQIAASPAADKADLAAKAVKTLVEHAVKSPDAPYRDYAEKQITDGCRAAAEFHNATSPAQRSKAVAKLGDYEKDLKTLAGQSGG